MKKLMKCSKILKTHKQKKYIYNKILKFQGVKSKHPKLQGCVLQFTLYIYIFLYSYTTILVVSKFWQMYGGVNYLVLNFYSI